MQHIHKPAKLALDRYRAATVERTDNLVTTLHELLLAHQMEGSVERRFAAMDAVVAPRTDESGHQCGGRAAASSVALYPNRRGATDDAHSTRGWQIAPYSASSVAR
jgi:hypothetical protein